MAVASPSVLAPFIVSLLGQDMVRGKAARTALGGTTVAEEPALIRYGCIVLPRLVDARVLESEGPLLPAVTKEDSVYLY